MRLGLDRAGLAGRWKPWRSWELWQRNLCILWAIELCAFVGLSLILPFKALGIDARLLSTTTGTLYAATGLTSLVAAPWWGRRGDRLGFRGGTTIALLGAAALLLLQGLMSSVAQLLALRLFYGCFVAGILPALFGFVSDASPSTRRGGVMGLSASATMLGNLLGPLSGGFVAAHVGLRAVFLLSAGALLPVTWYTSRLATAGSQLRR